MMSLSKERKERRLQSYDGMMMTRRGYNAALCGLLLYGIAANFIICKYFTDAVAALNPTAFLIGYLVCAIIGCLMSGLSHNPVISFIGYNLVVLPCGMSISIAVEAYGGLDSGIVVEAFMITLCITAAMTLFAIICPQFCSKLGGILFASLIGLILARLVMLIFGMYSIATAWIGAVIFSLYIAYDVWRSQRYPLTLDNAIDSALDIYLDIINLFLELLEILGKYKDDD